jgi:hypothetical protein
MSPTAYGHEQIVAAREIYGGDHIGYAGAASNQGRAFVMHPVPDQSRRIIPGRIRGNDVTAHTGPEVFDYLIVERRLRIIVRDSVQGCHRISS